jgi:hypothetical protein
LRVGWWSQAARSTTPWFFSASLCSAGGRRRHRRGKQALASLRIRLATGVLSSEDHAWLDAVVLHVAVVLSWRETMTAMVKHIADSLNKVRVLAFFCCYLLPHLPPPARGGSLESDGGLLYLKRRMKASCVGVSTLMAKAARLLFLTHRGSVVRS